MPKIIYKLKDGTEVPSTTTVIGKYKDMGGLLHYYWKEGKEGRGFNQRRDIAGDIGTAIHHLIERHIKGEPADPTWPTALSAPDAEIVAKMFFEFEAWWDTLGIKRVISTEASLTSEIYRYGGTVDLILETGMLSAMIMDWKTGRDFYQEMILQMAAYRWLCEETMGVLVTEAKIVTLSKEGKGIKVYTVTLDDMKQGFDKFLKLREVYDMEASLKTAVERIRDGSERHDNRN